MYDDRSEIRGPMDFDDAWVRFIRAVERSLINRERLGALTGSLFTVVRGRCIFHALYELRPNGVLRSSPLEIASWHTP